MDDEIIGVLKWHAHTQKGYNRECTHAKFKYQLFNEFTRESEGEDAQEKKSPMPRLLSGKSKIMHTFQSGNRYVNCVRLS